MAVGELIGALDQGTTSTRFMIFDHSGAEIARHQVPLPQHLPAPGRVEHDPDEIWAGADAAIRGALARGRLSAADLAAVGVTNQRETTLVWDRHTGRPYGPAIVWQDTRSDRIAAALARDGRGEVIRRRCGLPPAPYFSAGKLQWILEESAQVRTAAQRGDAMFGTVDTWLLWNLTGGADGGVHLTDVTNASRTMLMDLRTLDWDDELLSFFGIPRVMLPEIRASSEPSGYATSRSSGPFGGEVLLTGDLGDQQAATLGQGCVAAGMAKNTYGTGNFLLLHTGQTPVASTHGLLTTPAYRFAGEPASYALEGSIAVTGAAVQWLRDQLGIIRDVPEVEPLARSVPDTGGVYFVPAFSGLFAPYWRSDARGAIVGLTRFTTAAHLARATLESICYSTRDVLTAMSADAGQLPAELHVDGGITANSLCMQLQADILGVPVIRPAVAETTALGAAYAAGLAVGYWRDAADLRANWREDRRWEPTWSSERRAEGYRNWRRAVDRTLDWVGDGGEQAIAPPSGTQFR